MIFLVLLGFTGLLIGFCDCSLDIFVNLRRDPLSPLRLGELKVASRKSETAGANFITRSSLFRFLEVLLVRRVPNLCKKKEVHV